MSNRSWIVAGILVPCFLSLGCPVSMAQQLEPNSTIVGGISDHGLDFRTLASRTLQDDQTIINVFPFLPAMFSESAQIPTEIGSRRINLKSVADFLARTRATAVWNYGSLESQPSLHVMPTDVDEATREQEWNRVSTLLSPTEQNWLIILSQPGKESVDRTVVLNLTKDDIKTKLDELFSRYVKVRMLVIPNVIYIEPVANDAVDRRVAVFNRYADVLDNFRMSIEYRDAVDQVFSDLSAQNASNDAIASLEVFWQTDIRDLFERDGLNETETAKARTFADNFKGVIEHGHGPTRCNVWISARNDASNGAGAEIWYYKTLLGKQFAVRAAQTSTPKLLSLERALWTFVAYRNGEETGRTERVRFQCDGKSDRVVINEG